MDDLNAQRRRPSFIQPSQWQAPPRLTFPQVSDLLPLAYYPVVDAAMTIINVGRDGLLTVVLADTRYPCPEEEGPPFVLGAAENDLLNQLADSLLEGVIRSAGKGHDYWRGEFRQELGSFYAEVHLNRLPRVVIPVLLASRWGAYTVVADDDLLIQLSDNNTYAMLGHRVMSNVSRAA